MKVEIRLYVSTSKPIGHISSNISGFSGSSANATLMHGEAAHNHNLPIISDKVRQSDQLRVVPAQKPKAGVAAPASSMSKDCSTAAGCLAIAQSGVFAAASDSDLSCKGQRIVNSRGEEIAAYSLT